MNMFDVQDDEFENFDMTKKQFANKFYSSLHDH